jgi:Malectin domain
LFEQRKMAESKTKLVMIVISALVTYVIAYEQIYAINAGGDAHTDTDGIVYKEDDSQKRKKKHKDIKFDMENVPESDRNIYRYDAEAVRFYQQSIEFDIPLANDGLYLLIAKFHNHYDETCTQNMSLNSKIQLHSNVSLYNVCDGQNKICDEYFYFCISDKILYYQNQLSLVQNSNIHVEIHPVGSDCKAHIAGLVLLRGTFGERLKLNSSATNETINFHPVHPMCSTDIILNKLETVQEDQHQNSIRIQNGFCSINESTLKSIRSMERQSVENSNRLVIMEQQISKIKDRLDDNPTELLKQQVSEIKAEIQTSTESNDY